MFWVSKSQNSALEEGILSAAVALGVHSLGPWEALPQATVISILFCIASVQFKGHRRNKLHDLAAQTEPCSPQSPALQ